MLASARATAALASKNHRFFFQSRSSSSSSSSRQVRLQSVRRAVLYGVSGGIVVGGTSLTIYLNTTESGLGLRREIQFWKTILPIVGDYVWKTHSKSPYVWWQQQQPKQYLWNLLYPSSSSSSSSKQNNNKENEENVNDSKQQQEEDEERQQQQRQQRQQRRQIVLQQLHELHAPEVLNILLELKGLYIKLGQVLSVTAIPIPDQYRKEFQILQSDVSGWESMTDVIQPILEREWNCSSLDDILVSIDPIPCGAASIGQAHKAIVKGGILTTKSSHHHHHHDDDDDTEEEQEEQEPQQVIIKIQYPNAKWQIPADIHCIRDFLKLCVWLGVVEESSAQLSYDEFARQFLAELDYHKECENLQIIYESSLDVINAPYKKRNVILPKVHPELCTSQIITMSYLPGPKLQKEAQQQLQRLGINMTKKNNTKNMLQQLLPPKDQQQQQQQQQQPYVDDGSDSGDSGREASSISSSSSSSSSSTSSSFPLPSSSSSSSSPVADDGSPDETNAMTYRNTSFPSSSSTTTTTWKVQASQWFGTVVGVNSMLWAARWTQRILLWSTALAVTSIQTLSPWLLLLSSSSSFLRDEETITTKDDDYDEQGQKTTTTDREDNTTKPVVEVVSSGENYISQLLHWAQTHQTASEQAQRLSQTKEWIDALFDVHGHQIFNLGLFNADPHPGNIILVTPDKDDGDATTTTRRTNKNQQPQLGLIDFGQCKRLTRDEQVRVAEFILTIANATDKTDADRQSSDEAIASAFRKLGIQTQNDSTTFLADFARLMFGPLQPKHLQHEWHRKLHATDRVLYFPNELSMVYRTSLLLRGLAMSLQFNHSVSEEWKHHAQAAVDRERQEQENR